jgi:hypothetical protein
MKTDILADADSIAREAARVIAAPYIKDMFERLQAKAKK